LRLTMRGGGFGEKRGWGRKNDAGHEDSSRAA
jgi:hypothetical protein